MSEVMIDHVAVNHTVDTLDTQRESRMSAWHQIRGEFESLKASGAMLGTASDACQMSVMRVDEEVTTQNQHEITLFESIRHAVEDDRITEEESSQMFTALGGNA